MKGQSGGPVQSLLQFSERKAILVCSRGGKSGSRSERKRRVKVTPWELTLVVVRIKVLLTSKKALGRAGSEGLLQTS
jgi:hypothetical protein